MRKYMNEPFDVHQQMDCLMHDNYDDVYIQKDGIMSIVDEATITGNNRKYVDLYDRIAPLYRISNAVYFLAD